MINQTTRLIIRSFGNIPKREIIRTNRNLLFKRELNYQIKNKQFNSLYNKIQYRNLAVVNVKLESLGDSIPSAVILEWKKNVGDKVNLDDVVTVVETDKVTIELRAASSGYLVKQFGDVGAELLIGADLYAIDVDGSAPAATPSAPAPSTPAPTSTSAPVQETQPTTTETKVTSTGKVLEVPVPRMGESISQGIVSEWRIQEGGVVRSGDVVALLETDKVTIEVISPHSGKVVKLKANKGDEVLVDQALFVIEEGDVGPAPAKASTPTKASPSSTPATPSTPAATPAPAAAPKKADKPAATSTKTAVGDRTENRVKMTRMRQRIAERLKYAQNTAAILTTFQEVDMGALIDLRNKYKEDFEKKHNVKLGFMSAFVKASSAALMEIPAINARIDDATKEIVYHNYTDISVAVASPTGLVVPVLRNCEKMSFADVEKTIGMFGKKAKEGTLEMEDMAGGTFTISNGGVFGSLFGTPIINPPQSAILGMHATKQRAVVVNGKVEARPMMYLALTYDHRLIDGREAVTFLKSLQGKIEDPSKLLLDL